jgi:hypothetical protein
MRQVGSLQFLGLTAQPGISTLDQGSFIPVLRSSALSQLFVVGRNIEHQLLGFWIGQAFRHSASFLRSMGRQCFGSSMWESQHEWMQAAAHSKEPNAPPGVTKERAVPFPFGNPTELHGRN